MSPKVLSEAISEEAILYSHARKNATSGIIFSNILEARDRGISGYSTVTGIQSNPKSTYSSATMLTPIGLGNPSGPFQGSNLTLNQGADKAGTYSVNPVADGLDAGGSILYRKVPNSVFKDYWNNGWPKDLLLSLMVASYEIDGTTIINDGKSPEEIFTNIQNEIGTLDQITLDKPKNGQPTPPDVNCKNITDTLPISSILQNSSEETIKDRLATIATLYDGKIKVLPDGTFQRCDKPKKADKRIKLYGISSSGTASSIAIKLRSFDGMVYFVGETLRESPNEKYLYKSRKEYKNLNNTSDGISLMRVTPYGNEKDYAVWTSHRGNTIYTVKRLESPKYWEENSKSNGTTNQAEDRSQAVMTILRQVLELNQSKDFLKAPDNQFVVR